MTGRHLRVTPPRLKRCFITTDPQTARLIIVALVGIAALLLLIIHFKLHAFVTLLLVSVLIGLGMGMDPTAVLTSMQKGMGGTLGFVAIVVGLGAMFGQILETTGGAQVLARKLLGTFGEANAQWALGVAGFLISIPVFFDVGFVILAPILYSLHKKSGKPLMYFAMPLMGGMVVTHGFIPPTPGPIAVAEFLDAKLGHVILLGFITGIPAMICAGPLFARYIADRVPARIPESIEYTEPDENDPNLPPFGLIAFLIFLPIVLILFNTATGAILTDEVMKAYPDSANGDTHPMRIMRDVLLLVGHPFIALLITTIACFTLLGTRRGMSRDELNSLASKALEPAGIIILVTGAGGVLKQIMVDSNVGKLIAQSITENNIPLVFASFLLAAIVRVMQGSATVAMMTAGSLIAAIIAGSPEPPGEWMRALLVIPIASGATFCGHVNDSGFWLVNRYLGMDVPETLKSFTVMTTIIAIVGLAMSTLLSLFIA